MSPPGIVGEQAALRQPNICFEGFCDMLPVPQSSHDVRLARTRSGPTRRRHSPPSPRSVCDSVAVFRARARWRFYSQHPSSCSEWTVIGVYPQCTFYDRGLREFLLPRPDAPGAASTSRRATRRFQVINDVRESPASVCWGPVVPSGRLFDRRGRHFCSTRPRSWIDERAGRRTGSRRWMRACEQLVANGSFSAPTGRLAKGPRVGSGAIRSSFHPGRGEFSRRRRPHDGSGITRDCPVVGIPTVVPYPGVSTTERASTLADDSGDSLIERTYVVVC